MKKKLLALVRFALIINITGCATNHLTSPCLDYGKNCKKIPVNSWNYTAHT